MGCFDVLIYCEITPIKLIKVSITSHFLKVFFFCFIFFVAEYLRFTFLENLKLHITLLAMVAIPYVRQTLRIYSSYKSLNFLTNVS